MARNVEVWFFRHSIKGKGPNPDLTPEGIELAFKRGQQLRGSAPTSLSASSLRRTQQSAHHVGRGIAARGGRVTSESATVRPEFTFHHPTGGEPEPQGSIHLSPAFVAAYDKHSGTEVYRQYLEGRFKGIPTAEQAGAILVKWLAPFYHEAQGKASQGPTRHVMVTHGDSVAETVFYALTGTNPAVVKGKGTFSYMEGFKVVMDGKKMSVEFRGKKFKVLPHWRGALRKRNEAKLEARVRGVQEVMTRRRQALVAKPGRDPKRTRVFGRAPRSRGARS